MPGKKACIIVDLRSGQHVTKVPDLVAVLSAAGWKTRIALKEYGGEALKLAKKAAKAGYDLVIGYGGDGTLNDVVNGVMDTGGKSLIGDIPGGTYNEWASVMRIPKDPVKAALTLANSEPRLVDLGHVEVEALTFPSSTGDIQRNTGSKNSQKQARKLAQTRQYFLLHASMGIDAAIMAHISKPLKYSMGKFAFDLSALKELPEQHPFPVEVRIKDGANTLHWQGEAWQVIVSKTPYYAGAINIEPNARLDDGLLNICIISASNTMKTVEQALEFFLQHKFDKETSKYFRGTHISITIPASISMQVDGSVVKLEDYLSSSERDALKSMQNLGQVRVRYRFDAEPGAVHIAIPRTYDGSLFAKPPRQEASHSPSQQQLDQHSLMQQNSQQLEKTLQAAQGQEYKVTVIGATPNPWKKATYIIAGDYKKQNTDETELVTVRVDDRTLILTAEGERTPLSKVLDAQEGTELIVYGKKSKRNVIRASCVKLPQ